jgi:transglutaminase-like putative cysteine protease
MLVRYGFRMSITTPMPTAVLTRLDVHPAREPDLAARTPLTLNGHPAPKPFLDLHGNRCRRFTASAGTTTIECAGVARDTGKPEEQITGQGAVAVADLPLEALPYLVGSRYCETDKLGALAWNLFGKYPNAGDRVRAVVNHVHDTVSFGYGFARPTRTAAEALEERIGVCRDFAHATIGLCRALNIPARYVNGYLGDIGIPKGSAPMDFSAWAEVFLGGRWFTVDARHNHPRIGRIVIARGRDAADVPMIHSFGPHDLGEFTVITEELVEQPAKQAVAA